MNVHEMGGLIHAAWRVVETTDGVPLPEATRAAIGQLELVLLRGRLAAVLLQLNDLEHTLIDAVAHQNRVASDRDQARAWAAQWKRAARHQARLLAAERAVNDARSSAVPVAVPASMRITPMSPRPAPAAAVATPPPRPVGVRRPAAEVADEMARGVRTCRHCRQARKRTDYAPSTWANGTRTCRDCATELARAKREAVSHGGSQRTAPRPPASAPASAGTLVAQVLGRSVRESIVVCADCGSDAFTESLRTPERCVRCDGAMSTMVDPAPTHEAA